MTHIVEFRGSGQLAAYNKSTKSFKFIHENLENIRPADAVNLVEWIKECQAHKEGIKFLDSSTHKIIYSKPKSVNSLN
jgi:hypothetical protein